MNCLIFFFFLYKLLVGSVYGRDSYIEDQAFMNSVSLFIINVDCSDHLTIVDQYIDNVRPRNTSITLLICVNSSE
jgi:hypothetical protein